MKRSPDILLAALATLLLTVGGLGLHEASRWIGRTFPGFLVLENRVVASAGLESWPATHGGEIYQHEIVAVDGEPVASARALHARIQALPPHTPVTYRFRGESGDFERTFETRRFELLDFALLFGVYVVNGLAMGGIALVLRAWRRRDPSVSCTLPMLLVGACWGLTAMDLYGPYRLFRLHALCEVLLFPAALHMALGFPRPVRWVRRHPSFIGLPYAFALGLAIVYQAGLREPATYVTTHLLATSALGVGLLVLVCSQIIRYLGRSSPEVRAQIRALALGTTLAAGLPIVLTLAEFATGGSASQNAVGFTAFLLPLSIAWAALRGKPVGARTLAKGMVEAGRRGSSHG